MKTLIAFILVTSISIGVGFAKGWEIGLATWAVLTIIHWVGTAV